jgi:hypothetical protein
VGFEVFAVDAEEEAGGGGESDIRIGGADLGDGGDVSWKGTGLKDLDAYIGMMFGPLQ